MGRLNHTMLGALSSKSKALARSTTSLKLNLLSEIVQLLTRTQPGVRLGGEHCGGARVAADQSELAGGHWRFSFAKRQLILFQASNAS